MDTGCSSGWIRRNSRCVRASPWTRPKLDTISDTTSPAPCRFAWSRTNQLPIPASGASTTRLASWTPPSSHVSVSERTREKLAPLGGVERIGAVREDAHLALGVHQLDQALHTLSGAADREAAAVGARLPGRANDHREAVQVHEIHVAEVEHQPPAVGEQASHDVAHARSGGGVHLALNAHDRHAAAVVDRHVEW